MPKAPSTPLTTTSQQSRLPATADDVEVAVNELIVSPFDQDLTQSIERATCTMSPMINALTT